MPADDAAMAAGTCASKTAEQRALDASVLVVERLGEAAGRTDASTT